MPAAVSFYLIFFYIYLFHLQKDLIVMNEIVGVMGVDASANSHPLSTKEEEILRPEQINQLFDSITYSKVNHVMLDLSRSHFKQEHLSF